MTDYIYITEYAYPRIFQGNIIAAGPEPAITEQQVPIGGSSAQSAAFNANTKFIRVNCTAVCSLLFGANPTAVATAKRLSANQTEYFPVIAGHKVAVIANT